MTTHRINRLSLALALALTLSLLLASLGSAAGWSQDPESTPTPSEAPTATEPPVEPAAPTETPTAEATQVLTPTLIITPTATLEPTPEATLVVTSTTTITPTATLEPTQPPTAEPTPAPNLPPPTIASDLADYPPGGWVTLSGQGWQTETQVRIIVEDYYGSSWRRDEVVTVQENGSIRDYFQLPLWFVSDYVVLAIGQSTGATATTTFTDAEQVDTTTTLNAISSPLTPSQTGVSYSGQVSASPAVPNGQTVKLQSKSGGCGEGGSFGDIATTTTTSDNGSFSGTFTAPSTSGTYGFRALFLATGKIGDYNWKNSQSNCKEITVQSANTPPSVNRDNASVTVNEGATATNTGTWSDPNAGDTVTLSASVGTVIKSGTNASGTWSWSFATTDGPAQSQTVTITANDGNGGVTTTTFPLTVNNVAPTVTLSGASSADEGQTKSYSFTTSDPGQDTFSLVSQSCGANGTLSNAAFNSTTGAGSFDCTFPDGPASSTVSVQVKDSDNANSNTSTKTVTIANVAPTVAFTSGDTTVDENGVTEHTYTYSISDPGDDTISSVSTSCGTGGTKVGGSDSNSNTSGSFKCIFPDGPASPSVTASATDSDSATGNTASRTVTVNNVAPTVTLSGASSADEGQTKSYSYTTSDPGQDTFSLVSQSCGANGTLSNAAFNSTTGAGSFDCTFPDGPASSTVSVQVADSDGANSNIDTKTVTIANVAPTVTLSGPSSADEGQTKSYSYTTSDPGQDTFSLVSQSCGANGTPSNAAFNSTTGAGSFDCTFPDGPASSTVSVQVADSDGANSNIDTKTVTIANVAPTATFAATSPIDEGSASILSFSDPSDPSSADTSAGFRYAFACDGQDTSLPTTYAGAGTSSTANCTFGDNGSFTVKGRIFDKDDGYTTKLTTVVVNNVDPIVDAGANANINEGDTFSGSGSFTDPGVDSWIATVDYDDGAGPIALALKLDKTFDLSHVYADNGVYNVEVCVTDDDLGSDCDTAVVTVNNVAPTVGDLTIGGGTGTACMAGNNVTLDFSFTDPGLNDAQWAVDINWGDGNHTTYNTNSQGLQPQQSHTYSAGTYTVSVKVTDKDGGIGNNSSSNGTISFLWKLSNILQPINPGPPNSIFKYGSTIPVKVKVTDCDNLPVGNLTLKVTWQLLSSGTPTGVVSEPYSTSAADSGNTMRFTGAPDNQYIFNLASKSFPDGTATYRIYVTIWSTDQKVSADIGLKLK